MIKTNVLDSIKAQILSNSDLRNVFARCIVLFKDYLAQTKANKNPELNISAVNFHREGTECDSKKCKVEDQFYTMKEYCNLTPDQKKELKDLRDARGHNPKKTKLLHLLNKSLPCRLLLMGLKLGIPRVLLIHKIIIKMIPLCLKTPATITILLSHTSETRMGRA